VKTRTFGAEAVDRFPSEKAWVVSRRSLPAAAGRLKVLSSGSKSSSRLDSAQGRPICRPAIGGPLPVPEISPEAGDPLIRRKL
jgi:hypothetical protein